MSKSLLEELMFGGAARVPCSESDTEEEERTQEGYRQPFPDWDEVEEGGVCYSQKVKVVLNLYVTFIYIHDLLLFTIWSTILHVMSQLT